MQEFDCKIRTFTKDVLHRKIQSISFDVQAQGTQTSLDKEYAPLEPKVFVQSGQVTILPGHEESMFLINPGKIIVHIKDVPRIYLCGSGYVQIKPESIEIFAFPVMLEAQQAEMLDELAKLGEYGLQCAAQWQVK